MSCCAKENNNLLCAQCGFDGSCDYETYPSLGRFSGSVDSVSRRTAARRVSSDEPVRLNIDDYLSGLSVVEKIKQEQAAREASRKKADTALFQTNKDSPVRNRRSTAEMPLFFLGIGVFLFWLYLFRLLVGFSFGLGLGLTIIPLILTLRIQYRLLFHGFEKLPGESSSLRGSTILIFLSIFGGLIAFSLIFGLIDGVGTKYMVYGLLLAAVSAYYCMWAVFRK